jgi:hypothetical protein
MSIGRPISSKSIDKTTPGVGHYNVNLNNRNKAPSYKIGDSKREGLHKYLESNPGPGQYNNDKSNLNNNPSWR